MRKIRVPDFVDGDVK